MEWYTGNKSKCKTENGEQKILYMYILYQLIDGLFKEVPWGFHYSADSRVTFSSAQYQERSFMIGSGLEMNRQQLIAQVN